MTPIEMITIRMELGMKQPEFAQAIGYKPAAVSRFENGRKPIPISVELACEALRSRHQNGNAE